MKSMKSVKSMEPNGSRVPNRIFITEYAAAILAFDGREAI